jgi:hypothetical protein
MVPRGLMLSSMKHENSALGLYGPLDLGPRVFTRCRNVPKRVIFTLAELVGECQTARFPCVVPIRRISQWNGIPRQIVLQAHEKIRESVAFDVGR